jgi:hypothetical protein
MMRARSSGNMHLPKQSHLREGNFDGRGSKRCSAKDFHL